MTNALADPKDGRRPLYYEDFEGRVRNYCQRDVDNEFEPKELRAIVYDYLNVVYRGMWKSDDRFQLYEQTIALSEEGKNNLQDEVSHLLTENDCLSVKLNILTSKHERTICFKINGILNKLKSYLTWSKHNE